MFIIVHDGVSVEIPSAIDAEGPAAVEAYVATEVAKVKAAHEPAPDVIVGANPEE